MKELIALITLVVVFFVMPPSSLNIGVIQYMGLEVFLMFLLGYRRWKEVMLFAVLSLLLNWLMNTYLATLSNGASGYINLDYTIVYFSCLALYKVFSILIEGALLGLLVQYSKKLWLSVTFVNVISSVVGYLLNHWGII